MITRSSIEERLLDAIWGNSSITDSICEACDGKWLEGDIKKCPCFFDPEAPSCHYNSVLSSINTCIEDLSYAIWKELP